MLKKYFIFLLITSLGLSQHFTIARIHYSGGGDWYSDPSSIPNLLQYLSANTPISKTGTETRIRLTDGDAGHYPYLYLTGHGNIRFTEDEIISLRSLSLIHI